MHSNHQTLIRLSMSWHGILGAMEWELARTYEATTEVALKLLAGKWKTLILLLLRRHPCRYADFRVIPKLSDKVLTERLKDLQAAGLIERHKKTTNLYCLTARGESLHTVLADLHAWGKVHAGALCQSASGIDPCLASNFDHGTSGKRGIFHEKVCFAPGQPSAAVRRKSYR